MASVGGAVISDSPPPGPLTPGQLWWESNSGNTYLWFDDGTSQQWIQQNIQPATVANPLAGLTAQTRNRIVNGAMQISQENGNTAGTVNGYYPADQWLIVNVMTAVVQSQRVTSYTPNGSRYRARFTVNTADAAVAAGDLAVLRQLIEGTRIVDFKYGTATAKQSVLRFGFKAPAGTYSIRLLNSGADRSYVANFTIAVEQANTDTEQVFVIPGETTGAWDINPGIGFYLDVVLATGTTYHGAVGWTSGAFLGTSSNTNGMATAGNVFELYDVGLYLDPLNTGLAPRWEMPDEAEELRACQRYYRMYGRSTNTRLGIGTTYTSTLGDVVVPFDNPMRIAPAFTFTSALQCISSNGTNVAPNGVSAGSNKTTSAVISLTTASSFGATVGAALQLHTTDATGAIYFSARM